MKKRMMVTMVSFLLTAAMLTACGGATKETKSVRVLTDEEMILSGGKDSLKDDLLASADTLDTNQASDKAKKMVSDEDFAQIQDLYSDLLDLYNLTVDYYNLDCVSASTTIENKLNGVYKVLEKVGNKEQRNISDTDAIKLIQEMEKQADILDECLDLIEQQINGNGMGNTPVDDEMFAMLQEQYSDVVDLHNTIIDAYNAGLLKNSKEASETLDSIADLINAIGEVEREGLTVEDALEYQQDMIDAVNYLNEMLHYM